MHKNLFFFLFILGFISGCAIDDDVEIQTCEDVIGDSYQLLQTSIDEIPYFELPENTKFIFINEVGEEVVFRMESRNSYELNTGIQITCPNNPNSNYVYRYKTELETFNFVSDEITISFEIKLSTSLNSSDPESGKFADDLAIIGRDGGMFIDFVFLKTINKRTYDAPRHVPECFDEIDVAGYTLLNVCNNLSISSVIECYWNNLQGITMFSEINGVQWVLDRIE